MRLLFNFFDPHFWFSWVQSTQKKKSCKKAVKKKKAEKIFSFKHALQLCHISRLSTSSIRMCNWKYLSRNKIKICVTMFTSRQPKYIMLKWCILLSSMKNIQIVHFAWICLTERGTSAHVQSGAVCCVRAGVIKIEFGPSRWSKIKA